MKTLIIGGPKAEAEHRNMLARRAELTNKWLESKIKGLGLENKVQSFFIDIDHVTFYLKFSTLPKKEKLLALEKIVDEKVKYSIFQVDIHS